MPGWKQPPLPPPPAPAYHDNRTGQTSSTAPQATQRIPAAAHSKPAHGTGRGASFDNHSRFRRGAAGVLFRRRTRVLWA